MDVLDLTHNLLQDSMESIVATLSLLTSLSELKLMDGNTILIQSAEMNPIAFHLLPPLLQSKLHPTSSSNSSIASSMTLTEALPKVLPQLRRLDTNPTLFGEENSRKEDKGDFHTW
jgi:hypothetical protein